MPKSWARIALWFYKSYLLYAIALYLVHTPVNKSTDNVHFVRIDRRQLLTSIRRKIDQFRWIEHLFSIYIRSLYSNQCHAHTQYFHERLLANARLHCLLVVCLCREFGIKATTVFKMEGKDIIPHIWSEICLDAFLLALWQKQSCLTKDVCSREDIFSW